MHIFHVLSAAYQKGSVPVAGEFENSSIINYNFHVVDIVYHGIYECICYKHIRVYML